MDCTCLEKIMISHCFRAQVMEFSSQASRLIHPHLLEFTSSESEKDRWHNISTGVSHFMSVMCMHLAVFRYPGSISSHSGVKYIEFKISPSGFWELIPDCRLTADFSYQAFLDAWCLLSRLYAMLWAVHQTWMTMKRFLCNYADGLYLDFVLLMNTCYCCQQTRVVDTCMQKIAAVI